MSINGVAVDGAAVSVAAPQSELEAARAEIAGLHAALETRTTIGIAIGTLMTSRHLTEERAFTYLVELSSRSNTKIRDIAATMVEEANRRGARDPLTPDLDLDLDLDLEVDRSTAGKRARHLSRAPLVAVSSARA